MRFLCGREKIWGNKRKKEKKRMSKRENWKREKIKGKCLGKILQNGKIPKTPKKLEKWNNPERSPNIHKNSKYYIMAHGEIIFQ